MSLHPLDDGPDAGRAAGAPIGRFQGDDDEIRGAEGGIAGQRHSRRTIQQYVIVVRPKLGNRVGQGGMESLAFPLAGLRKVLPGEVSGHRDNVDVRVFGLPDEVVGLGIVARIEKPFHAGWVAYGREESSA